MKSCTLSAILTLGLEKNVSLLRKSFYLLLFLQSESLEEIVVTILYHGTPVVIERAMYLLYNSWI